MLVHVSGAFGILFATHIASDGHRRFSIAHELGHVFLPGHADAMIRGLMPPSRAHFLSTDPFEREADQFAASLLMPRSLFDRTLRTSGEGLAAVQRLASACGTSLAATAIRYVERTRDPVAVVIGEADTIRYAAVSRSLRGYPGAYAPFAGAWIPSDSARRFSCDGPGVWGGKAEEHEVDFGEWFGYGRTDARLLEEKIGLGRWGRSLIVLTGLDLPIEEHADGS